MRHAWKIAMGSMVLGLLLYDLRSRWDITDALAVPGLFVCVLGFAAFVLIGSLRRDRR